MHLKFRAIAFFVFTALQVLTASRVHAIDYDESIHGDLSGNPAAPTSLGTLGVGSHTLRAGFFDEDYDLATFTLAPGTYLDSIYLNSYGGSTASFSGLQAGSTWTAGFGFGVDPAPLLGWVLFGESTLGTDILDDYAMGADAIGFSPPLPPGTYTLEFQETGSFPVSAEFTLNVVPEPSTLATASITVASMGIVALLAHRRRRHVRV